MQEIARDTFEALQLTNPAEAAVWQGWIGRGEARIVDRATLRDEEIREA